jgi:hypothetical protein
VSKCLEKRTRVGRGVIKTGGGKRAVPCYVGHGCLVLYSGKSNLRTSGTESHRT